MRKGYHSAPPDPVEARQLFGVEESEAMRAADVRWHWRTLLLPHAGSGGERHHECTRDRECVRTV